MNKRLSEEQIIVILRDPDAGSLLKEVIWLGNLPICVIDGTSATPVLHYIESDHLGTYSTRTFRALSFAYP